MSNNPSLYSKPLHINHEISSIWIVQLKDWMLDDGNDDNVLDAFPVNHFICGSTAITNQQL